MEKHLKLGTKVKLTNEPLEFKLISKDGCYDNIYIFENIEGKKVSYIYNLSDESDYPNIKIRQNPNIVVIDN